MKDKDELQEIYIRPCKWLREGRTTAQKQTALAVGCTLYLGHEETTTSQALYST